MVIHRILTLTGVSALMLGIMLTDVEAKRSHHEVRAQHSSHSTTHRAKAAKAHSRLKGTQAKKAAPSPKSSGGSLAAVQERNKAGSGQDAARLGALFVSAAGSDLPARSLRSGAPKAAVKSVTFDVEAGIKTTVLTDGTIEEEPFDSGMLSELVPDTSGMNGLATYVQKLQRVSLPATTGSTAIGQTAH